MKPTIDACKCIEWKLLGDERGGMVAVEGGIAIPFDIKRVFYIYGAEDGAVRGRHANNFSEFVLVCLRGRATVKVWDGAASKEYVLDRPNLGLYIPRRIWKEMYDFSADCVMLTLADTHYDPTEYIKDSEEYMRIVRCGDD